MSLPVRFATAADRQLGELLDYIAERDGIDRAVQFVDAIISHCESLGAVPRCGTARDDIRPGLRTTGFRGRVLIAFAEIDVTLLILGVFYGGQDHVSRLTELER